MSKKVIKLDAESKKRIVRLVALHGSLLQNRRAKLGRATTILYGFCVCSGFLLLMGFIREGGWFMFAPALMFLFAGCWLVAEWLNQLKNLNAVKIRIR